ncbi:MAG: pseudouridine synthase, partial [bacterium]|nr:pseudouridine synthase [bacterium]
QDHPTARESQTYYEVSERFDGFAALRVLPKTGRTHQIRVHLAALRHPIVGDAVYGTADPELGRHFLHAAKLRFTHPRTRRSLTVDDPLPDDLKAFLRELDKHVEESNPST